MRTDHAAGGAVRDAYRARGWLWHSAAIALVILAGLATAAFARSDELFGNASQETRSLLPASVPEAEAEEPDPMGGIAIDRLWEAQGDLVAREAQALHPRVAGQANIYTIAVAAGGGQQLFAREAKLALDVAAKRFGPTYRGGLLLSNGAADLLRHPLASRTNFVAAAGDVGAHAGGPEDIAFIYLASHGSDEAFVETNLPNYQNLTPISASSVARALGQAGIRRRVIVVSACFAASWIPALADDDTIVIAAAARDRTSFGCDDSRDVTYFGEAFLKGSLARGGSLRDAFEEARRKIAGWEKAGQLDPSKPEAYVGRNMRLFWTARQKR